MRSPELIHLSKLQINLMSMLQKLTAGTGTDLELKLLHKVAMRGWPQTKEETPVEVRPYGNYRDEISCYEGVMFKGISKIIPRGLRSEILLRIHATHNLGTEKCRARASLRSQLFFGMSRNAPPKGTAALIQATFLSHCVSNNQLNQ